MAMSVFVQIAERGSLTAAADVTGKSLPSVVRILANLEEALQARLVNRTTRRLSLTEEGRLYNQQLDKRLKDQAKSAELKLEDSPREIAILESELKSLAPAVTAGPRWIPPTAPCPHRSLSFAQRSNGMTAPTVRGHKTEI